MSLQEMKHRLTLILVLALGTVATCSEPVAPPELILGFTTPSAELEVADTVAVSPTVTTADGSPVDIPPLTWTSSDAAIASVGGTGVIIAVSPGTATITVSAEGKSFSRDVRVIAQIARGVTLNESAPRLYAGSTVTLLATVLNKRNTAIANSAVQWQSADSGIAVVSSAGVVTGVQAGTTTITASAGSHEATATTVVINPVASVSIGASSSNLYLGTQLGLSATLRDAGGAALVRPVTWSSSNPSVASVGADGNVSGLSVGTATITATSEGVSSTVTLAVTVRVASVIASPTSFGLRVGETRTLTPTALDAGGAAITGRVFTLSSTDGNVATVTSAGLVTAVGPGSANIIAVHEAQSVTVPITVTAVPVNNIVVTPTGLTRMVTEVVAFTAVTRDSANNPLAGRAVTWATSNATLATIGTSGSLTARAPGVVTVSASSEGQTGTATITIINIPVSTVTLSSSALNLIFGQLSPLTATLRDSLARAITDRPITWSSSNPAVASVTSAGVVKAEAAGTATITATSEGKSASLTATVTVPVSSVTVAPGALAILRGEARTIAGAAKDSTGAVLTGRPIGYASNNPLIATVTPGGVVTGANVGATTITVNSEGVTTTVPVTVAPVPVATLSLGTSPVSLMNTQVDTFTAVTLDSVGGVLTGRTITWSTGDPTIATVNASGIVTAQELVGSTTLTATSEGKSVSITINVIPIPIHHIDIVSSAPWMLQGTTTIVTATPKDSLDRPLTGRAVALSTLNTAVATVSGTGTLTGVAVGFTQLTATSEGKSKTVPVTVADALFPNEPGGSTQVIVRQFNTSAVNSDDVLGAEGFVAGAEATPFISVIDDPGAPISAPKIMRYRYPTGGGAGSSFSAGGIEKGGIFVGAPPGGWKTIYIAAWIRFSADFQGHLTGDQKLFEAFYGSNQHVRVKAFFFPSAPVSGLGNIETTYSLLNTTNPANQRPQPPGIPGVGFTRGQWHRVEILSTLSTPGASDGILRWWIDGVLAGNITDLTMLNADETAGWTTARFVPVWGGGGDTVRAEMYLDMDHMRVAVSP